MSTLSPFADALACHQAGRLDEAERLYRQVPSGDAHHADALHLMGVIAYQQGRHDPAAGLIRRAIASNPKAASYRANLGLVLREQGLLEEAATCQRDAILLAPNYPEAHNNLGLLCQDQGQLDEAAACYRRAIALRPKLPEAHNNLANVLEEQGRLDEAAASCRTALQLRPDFPHALNSMGIILARQGQWDEAVAFYRKAMALKPDYADAGINLGHALASLGHFEDAEAAYHQALSWGGDPAAAYHGLSACRKFTPQDRPLVAKMEATLANPGLTEIGRSQLHFALGKIFDELGDYQQAIGHFDTGNGLEHKKHDFDKTGFAARIDRLIEADPMTPSHDASASQLPLLIVGMPRSGTTLVEQILASHHQVAAGGELGFWLQCTAGVQTGQARQPSATFERAAIEDYLKLLGGIGPNAARVTDKMPYNFLAIGLAHRLFPKARIIHCRRNPLDTALSIYFSRFARPHVFAYDRQNIVFYYNQYRRLMDHWRSVMPPEQFLELDYEELVADQPAVSRHLVAFCGLAWDEACLDFFRTERPIGTLSAWQARQPLYRSSVERWQHYQPWLGALETLRVD